MSGEDSGGSGTSCETTSPLVIYGWLLTNTFYSTGTLRKQGKGGPYSKSFTHHANRAADSALRAVCAISIPRA